MLFLLIFLCCRIFGEQSYVYKLFKQQLEDDVDLYSLRPFHARDKIQQLSAITLFVNVHEAKLYPCVHNSYVQTRLNTTMNDSLNRSAHTNNEKKSQTDARYPVINGSLKKRTL